MPINNCPRGYTMQNGVCIRTSNRTGRGPRRRNIGEDSVYAYGNVKCNCENSGGQIDLDTNSSGHHSWVSGICKRLCPNNTQTMIY